MTPRPLLLASLLTLLVLLLTVPAASAQYGDPDWGDDEEQVQEDSWGEDGHDDEDDDRRGDGDDEDERDWWEQQQPAVPQPAVPAPLPIPVVPALPEVPPLLPTTKQSVVPGTKARMRTDGRAAIPRGAPKPVRQIIRAANEIVGKPYKWGGGHRRLADSGYDCSGSVSYALIKGGLQRSSVVSGRFARMYAAGAGRHVTIYAHSGHVYMEIAGLRLDTSAVGDTRGRKGVRWRPVIGKRSGFKVRHPAGL